MLEAPAYDMVDVVEAELIDLDDTEVTDVTGLVDLIARDAEPAVEALVVDTLARDLDLTSSKPSSSTSSTPSTPTSPRAPRSTGCRSRGEPKPRRHLHVAPDLVGRRRRVRIAAAGAAVAISPRSSRSSASTSSSRSTNPAPEAAGAAPERTAPLLRPAQGGRGALGSPKIVGEAQAAGLVPTTNSDLTVNIPQPPQDQSGETGLRQIQPNAGGSLGNLQP